MKSSEAGRERLLTVHVGGMGCRRCVRDVSQRLRDVPGVRTLTVDGRASVAVVGGTMAGEAVLAALGGSGYAAELIDDADGVANAAPNMTGAT
jgi:copper chaperone CopZ